MKLSVLASAAVLALASVSQAAILVSFDPVAVQANTPEVTFGGAPKTLDEAAGFKGSGVGGTLGLQVQTPLTVTAVPGFTAMPNGATLYTDVSLTLTGLSAVAPAQSFLGLIGQPLTNGTFVFTSSAASGAADLLSGTISGVGITAIAGSDTGSVLSATITYTSGAIYNALIAAGGSPVGSLSWTLLDASPTFSVDVADGILSSFSASVNGQFSTPVIPEPAALGLLAPVAFLLGRRR
jgi:hypothetical protein